MAVRPNRLDGLGILRGDGSVRGRSFGLLLWRDLAGCVGGFEVLYIPLQLVYLLLVLPDLSYYVIAVPGIQPVHQEGQLVALCLKLLEGWQRRRGQLPLPGRRRHVAPIGRSLLRRLGLACLLLAHEMARELLEQLWA